MKMILWALRMISGLSVAALFVSLSGAAGELDTALSAQRQRQKYVYVKGDGYDPMRVVPLRGARLQVEGEPEGQSGRQEAIPVRQVRSNAEQEGTTEPGESISPKSDSRFGSPDFSLEKDSAGISGAPPDQVEPLTFPEDGPPPEDGTIHQNSETIPERFSRLGLKVEGVVMGDGFSGVFVGNRLYVPGESIGSGSGSVRVKSIGRGVVILVFEGEMFRVSAPDLQIIENFID